MTDRPQLLTALTDNWFHEWNDAIDYAWKAPTLIKHQTRIERRKLTAYFGDDKRAKRQRWSFESRKLQETFPRLLATGTLSSVASLFELCCHDLATVIDSRADAKLATVRGQGTDRLLTFLRRSGLPTDRLPLWPQVEAGLRIRNCLLHAGGFLGLSRDRDYLRRIIKSRVYLTRAHRAFDTPANDPLYPVVSISEHLKGSRLEITHGYAWMAASYFRDYFLSLAETAV